MPPPPQMGKGVFVVKEIVGTSVTLPDCATTAAGAGVHVGGRLNGVNGSAGPSGCVAKD